MPSIRKTKKLLKKMLAHSRAELDLCLQDANDKRLRTSYREAMFYKASMFNLFIRITEERLRILRHIKQYKDDVRKDALVFINRNEVASEWALGIDTDKAISDTPEWLRSSAPTTFFKETKN